MKQSPQITARINTIAKELANGEERGEIVTKYVKKWQTNARTVDRYIKNAKIIAETLTEKAKKATEDVYVASTTEAAKNGLKSKFERVMFYQNEIDKMESQLRGETKFTFVLGSSIKNSHTGDLFVLPVQVQNDIRATIKSYQTEISKIEGDYAPEQSKGEMILTWQENKTYQKK